eukprot:9284326-Karenia_brevis.AAC.1
MEAGSCYREVKRPFSEDECDGRTRRSDGETAAHEENVSQRAAGEREAAAAKLQIMMRTYSG